MTKSKVINLCLNKTEKPKSGDEKFQWKGLPQCADINVSRVFYYFSPSLLSDQYTYVVWIKCTILKFTVMYNATVLRVEYLCR